MQTQLTLLAFAKARDDLGFSSKVVSFTAGETPLAVLQRVAPGFDFSFVRVAIDLEFVDWDTPIPQNAREIALIPPVSGG